MVKSIIWLRNLIKTINGKKIHEWIFYVKRKINQPKFVVKNIFFMPIKDEFPAKDSDYLGGSSDGFVYRTAFAGATLAHSFEMVGQFLMEEGYGDLPMPKDVNEMEQFRLLTRNKQILMFEDNGYVHNPVKILFPMDGRKKKTLMLEIYNESASNHLLRFHRRLSDQS